MGIEEQTLAFGAHKELETLDTPIPPECLVWENGTGLRSRSEAVTRNSFEEMKPSFEFFQSRIGLRRLGIASAHSCLP